MSRLAASTIRARIVVLVAALMIPTLLAAAGAVWYAYREKQVALDQGLRDGTRLFALAIDAELGRREAIARTLAESQSLAAGDLARFHSYAARIAGSPDEVVVLATPDGQQVVNTRVPYGSPLPRSIAATMEKRRVAGKLATVVSDLYMAPIGKSYSFSVQVPVLRDGEPVYYLSVASFASNLQPMMRELRLPEGWNATVVDHSGTIVARNRAAEQFVGKPVTDRLLKQMASSNQGVFKSVNVEGIATLTSFAKSPTYGWTVAIGVPRAQLGIPARAAAAMSLAAALLLGAALAAALFVGRRIVKPVESLAAASEALGRAEHQRFASTGLEEVDRVVRTLEAASERIANSNEELRRRVREAIAETEKVQRAALESQRLEALGQLTGGVAHDFNNLLMVVSNNTHLLKRQHAQLLDSPSLLRIERAVETGSRLTRQLLAFARRQPLRPEVIDLNARLRDLVDLLRPTMGRVEVNCTVAPGTNPILVDASELELALINLAMNARDAMPEGGRLTFSASNKSPGSVLIEVADTGQGIPAEVLGRVFDPFFTTKPSGKGTGLGLSQVYGFCKQAGGEARVESWPGQGTTVYLELPPATCDTGAPERPQPRRTLPTGTGKTLLLVEDNRDLAEGTRDILADAGFDVTCASNADLALELLASRVRPFDVILSDIRMPGAASGIDLARWARDRGLPSRVMLMTGYSGEIQHASEEGLDVLPKPVTPEALLAALAVAEARYTSRER